MNNPLDQSHICQNNTSRELFEDIEKWLNDIAYDGTCYEINHHDRIEVLLTFEEYQKKFRDEFVIRTSLTIKEVEDEFIKALEFHLSCAFEELLEIKWEAQSILEDSDIDDDYLDFCHCTEVEELHDLAQSDIYDAMENWENAKAVLAELKALSIAEAA